MMDRLSEEGGREESEATLYQDIENLFGCTSKLGHFCLREKLLNGIAINHLPKSTFLSIQVEHDGRWLNNDLSIY